MKMVLIAIIASVGIAHMSRAQKLEVHDRRVLDQDSAVLGSICLGGDTAMFISRDGLYIQCDSHGSCRKLIGNYSSDEQIPFNVCESTRMTRLALPLGIWQFKDSDADIILVHLRFCGELYRFFTGETSESFLTKWDVRRRGDIFEEVCIQPGIVLSSLWQGTNELALAVYRAKTDSYGKIFRSPKSLIRYRDSVGLDHSRFCIPAFNPQDSTIWMGIIGYRNVYIIDLNGRLIDSIQIENNDYKCPQPPKSRMKSAAVVHEWFSHWTPIDRFYYVPPGYFLMQYTTGVDSCDGSHRSISTTIVWDAKQNVVPLTVNPHWRVVGVQPDGRVTFATREQDSTGCKEVLYVTRIEP